MLLGGLLLSCVLHPFFDKNLTCAEKKIRDNIGMALFVLFFFSFLFFKIFFLKKRFFVLALLTQDLKTGTVKATAVGWSKHPPKFYNVAEDFDCTLFFVFVFFNSHSKYP